MDDKSINKEGSKTSKNNTSEQNFGEKIIMENGQNQNLEDVYSSLRKSVIYILQDIAFIAKMPLKNKDFHDIFKPDVFLNKLLM